MPSYICFYCGAEKLTAQSLRKHIQHRDNCKTAFYALSENHVEPVTDNSSIVSPAATSFNYSPEESSSSSRSRSDSTNVAELQSPSKQARVDDEEEMEPGGLPRDPFCHFPGDQYSAGQTYGKGPNVIEAMAEARRKEGISDQDPWAPFASGEEWEFVRWAMQSGVSQGDIDKYLKLEMTQTRSGLSFKNKQLFFAKVVSLPKGPNWQCEVWEVKGTEVDENENMRTEVVKLWKRNPVECIKDLLANPMFADHMRYKPERLYEDEDGKRPIFNEMWTGEWWEKLQKLLPTGATIVPVILASDKTQLSTFSGDKSAWPCMSSLLEPLVQAGTNGVEMVCADGFIRHVYPIIAAYIADHPEQCLVACTRENACPKCETHHSPFRDPEQTKSWIDDALHGWPRAAKDANIRPIKPFWASLPHCDIFQALTPDILHQLHKGMFKDHLVKWTTACVGGKETEIDRCYHTMTAHPGLRHFKRGISLVSQWTGAEYKHMEKVFLGIIAGSADQRVEGAVRTVLDFIHYAHFETQNEDSLSRLEASWRAFHDTKSVFLELGVRQHFNIAKLHSMSHYVRSIWLLGTADGYNTENPERLHIDFAKIAYRASNKKDYIKQMTKWLERQDSMQRFQAYLEFFHPTLKSGSTSGTAEDEGDSDNEHAEGGEQEDEDREHQAEYNIAKRVPFPRMSIATIENDMGAVDFKKCLGKFLQEHLSSSVREIDVDELMHVEVYKQFKRDLPLMSQVLEKSSVDIIRAAPPLPAQGRRQAVPAQFSTVLAFKTSGDHGEKSRTGVVNPIAGLTVGEVHLIFNVPRKYQAASECPLAYMEWFTGLESWNHSIGMFSVSPSSRNHRCHASIIPITQIQRTCHLIPVFGTAMDTTWTRENVAQRSHKFFVNPYL
ncbi:hypothetical protein BC835DRAFT_1409355 [Cytidiella melzeri]|nr:hypothetical protein BC835DRAFT_1409355 [Cytidiella melzeri]